MDKLPSNPQRSSYTHALIETYDLIRHLSVIEAQPATRDELIDFHCREYIGMITLLNSDFILGAEYIHDKESAEFYEKSDEFGLLNDCPVFDGLEEYVKWVAGASITAAKALCSREYDIVLAWDGGRHHAGRSLASGFCYVNDVVLAIFKLEETFKKIFYIDIDIHHGDGVERAFEFSPKVFTLSFHRYDPTFFPGTGSIADIGFGNGQFYSLNIPLKSGLNGPNFLEIFQAIVDNVLSCYSPDAIVMQCGVDGLFGDPLGGKWNLDIESFGQAVGYVTKYNIPTILLGGGGYSQSTAARCWTYCTAVALGMEQMIPMDIPEHRFLPEYGPDFSIFIDTGNQQDENEVGKYSDTIMNEALNLLKKLDIRIRKHS